MPRTTKASKLQVSSASSSSRRKPRIPSLASLAKDSEAQEDDDEKTPQAVRNFSRSTLGDVNGNLQKLFSAEKTVVKQVVLRGNRGKQNAEIVRTDRMAIFLRVRPFLTQELAKGENQNCFALFPEAKGIAFNPPKSSGLVRRMLATQKGKIGYEFTKVLSDELSQADVFESTMRLPIQEFLQGDSQLLFTYGVTNSGKTYTLLGPRGNPGILPRALNRVFAALGTCVSQDVYLQPSRFSDVTRLTPDQVREALAKRNAYLAMKAPKYPKANEDASEMVSGHARSVASNFSDGQSSTTTNDSHGFFDLRPLSRAEEEVRHDREFVDDSAEYYCWVSFLEIYEDMLYDLLDFSGSKGGRVLRSGTLKLTDEGDSSYVKGLIEVPVCSAADAYHILGLGRKNLHVAATKLNEASSRSHAIFTLRVVKRRGNEADVSQLTFCDLAGSERAGRTENMGSRLKESQNINKDLHHLKECIEALQKTTAPKASKRPRRDMVPYRNCKLTRLFRSFFCGRGKASMIVNISQCASDFDETVQAIRFGSSAGRIFVPLTRRESILVQPPQFDGPLNTTALEVVSVALPQNADPIGEIYDEQEEDDYDSDNEKSPSPESAPSTVKKQPLRNAARTYDIPKAVARAAPSARKRTITKTRKTAMETVKKAPKDKLNKTVDLADLQLDTAGTSSETSASEDTDLERNLGSTSDSTADSDVYEEEDDIAELDLTLGSAVKGTYTIPDDFWERNCPFDQFVGEEDTRIRGLLLMIGELQTQLKQSKGAAVAQEMKVRKELCDHFEKEMQDLKRQHKQDIQRIEKEADEDRERQLQYQAEQLEYQHAQRGDPSLLRYEKTESILEHEAAQDEIKALKRQNKELLRKLKYQEENGEDAA